MFEPFLFSNVLLFLWVLFMCPPSHYLSKDGQGLLVGTAHNCAHRPLGSRNRFTTLVRTRFTIYIMHISNLQLKYVLRWELADLGYQVGGWGHVNQYIGFLCKYRSCLTLWNVCQQVRVCQLSAAGHIRVCPAVGLSASNCCT